MGLLLLLLLLLHGFLSGFVLQLVEDTSHLTSAWRHDFDEAGWIQVHGNLQLGAGGVGMADVVVKVFDGDGDPLGVETVFSLWEGKSGSG